MKIAWLRAICSAVLLLPSSLLAAEFHGSAGVQHHDITISDTSFSARALTGVAGIWFQPGIGLEAGLSLPFSSDTENSVTVEMNSLLTLGLRFESPPTANGTSVFFLAGMASARLDGTDNNGIRAGNRGYTGPFVGFGLAQRISQQFIFTADYVQHTVDESIDIPSAQIALRHYF